MTTLNTQDQIPELSDEQLEAAQGGDFGRDAARFAYEYARSQSVPIRFMEWFGGGRAPWQ